MTPPPRLSQLPPSPVGTGRHRRNRKRTVFYPEGEWISDCDKDYSVTCERDGITPTRNIRPPFPPASFPVVSPVRLRLPVSPVSPATPTRLPGSLFSSPRLPGSLWSPPRPGSPWSPPSPSRLTGLIRPPGLGLSPVDRTASQSDHEGVVESDFEDTEGVESNGSDSAYIEAEDGPGILIGRTIRRQTSRARTASPPQSSSTLSQYLNQVREEMEVEERDNNISEQSVVLTPPSSPNLVMSLSPTPAVRAPDPGA